MSTFFQDIQTNIQTYYQSLIALLPKLLLAVLVFLILYAIANSVSRSLNKRLESQMDDPLLARFLSRIARIGIIIIAFLIFLKIIGLGAAAGSILAGAGVSAFVIGFAFKDIGENFLAGIMMAFNRPFRIGDVVELTGVTGKVITLNLRDTQIKTFDGKDVYIPNGNVLKNPVINYTIDGFIRNDFSIGLDYGSDILKAQKIILDVIKQEEGVLQGDKAPNVQLTSLGNSRMNMTAYYWFNTLNTNVSPGQIKTQLIQKCFQALDEQGYYIPKEVLEIKNYHDTQLKAVRH
ncbi:MAG: mechanosensitive ion channel family protein [Bacteroidota bacterium]